MKFVRGTETRGRGRGLLFGLLNFFKKSHFHLRNSIVKSIRSIISLIQTFLYSSRYLTCFHPGIQWHHQKFKNSLRQKSRFSILNTATILIFPKTQILTINSRLPYTFFIIFHIATVFPDDFLKNPYKHCRKNLYRLKKFHTFIQHEYQIKGFCQYY